MIISQKCNCCNHEEVCGKCGNYMAVCEKIKNEVGYFENGLVNVDIKCPHFLGKTRTKGNEYLPQNRGDNNAR